MWRVALAATLSLPMTWAADEGSTAWQQKLLADLKASAPQRSAAAAAALEGRLDAPPVRAALESCAGPELAALPARALAQRLREEIATVEIVSGFADTGYGMTLEEAMNGPGYFENSWELGVRRGENFSTFSGWLNIQDDVEAKLYGFRPFRRHGSPQSTAEASERTPYFMANLYRVDAGSQLYGDISVVLTPSLAREASVVSAVDTGGWTGMCNRSSLDWPPPAYDANCSAYEKFEGRGTLDHFDHLVLPNLDYWKGSLAHLACRLLAPWGQEPLAGVDLIHYWEAMPAARLSFPSAIKFVIASFPDIFGTSNGRSLQEWCKKQGWVLVWSLGLNLNATRPNFWTAASVAQGQWSSSDQRLADPEVLTRTSASLNASAASQTADVAVAFHAAWASARATRDAAAANSSTVSNVTWASAWSDLKEAMPADLFLQPLRAGACADIDRCVGTVGSGTCLCYAAAASTTELIV